MLRVFCLCLIVCTIWLPVSAADVGGDVDGIVSDPTVAQSSEASDPDDLPELSPVTESDPAIEEGISALADDGMLAGGYYFVCDCALGYDLMFYVPLEWAHDVFTFDSSGDLVNLSNSTCYAYCPQYPDYTFSCSRFGTFTYRASNVKTS